MNYLYLDCETYNAVDLKTVGTYKYAETAEILLITYAFNDGPVRCIDMTSDPCPVQVKLFFRDVTDPKIIKIAHNAMFDRAVLNAKINPSQVCYPREWHCTMVQALAHGFPGSLDELGRVLGLPQDKQKLLDGKKLINRFCKPAPKNHKADRYSRFTHPDEWARFIQYAMRDIEAMRAIHRKLPTWNWGPNEIKTYHLDQEINDRGFEVDRALTEAGALAAAREKVQLARRFKELTGGQCTPTQREKFRVYLNSNYGLGIDNTQRATLEPLISNDTVHQTAQELMQIALQVNKTSTAKYATLAPAVGSDGRFRGGLQFCGAARTRRWAGRVFQPQNLPSRGLPKPFETDAYIDALKRDDGSETLLSDNLMLQASAALRGVVVAPRGKRLFVADLANIEGRANAFLAGENWKLEAFKRFDLGTGPDLYNVTAAQILGKRPDEVDRLTERNTFGKVPELALGYQGGVGAFQTFSKNYAINMGDHAERVIDSLNRVLEEKARENWAMWGKKSGVQEREWLACEMIKLAWRERHPATVKQWYAIENAARDAIENQNTVYFAGPHLKVICTRQAGHRYLVVKMPSGGCLCYFDPRLDDEGKITYMGVDAITRQWVRLSIYGGKFMENACQSFSRDILAYNMHRVTEAGYLIVLTVHDEVVSEAGADRDLEHYVSLVGGTPPFAVGMPIAAEGFECLRYGKQ